MGYHVEWYGTQSSDGCLGQMKIIAQVTSPQNGFSLMVLEVTDETWIDGTILCRYMGDVVSFESYPVCSMEQWLKVKEKLPLEKIPKK